MNDDWYEKEQLHFAAQDGDLERVKELIQEGYDINAFDQDLSWTPLHCAAQEGHIEVVKYLLSQGADVNAYEEEKIGETPLGQVAEECSYEMAETLIKAGADPTIQGWMQLTALYRASTRTNSEGMQVYELLLKTAKKQLHNHS